MWFNDAEDQLSDLEREVYLVKIRFWQITSASFFLLTISLLLFSVHAHLLNTRSPVTSQPRELVETAPTPTPEASPSNERELTFTPLLRPENSLLTAPYPDLFLSPTYIETVQTNGWLEIECIEIDQITQEELSRNPIMSTNILNLEAQYQENTYYSVCRDKTNFYLLYEAIPSQTSLDSEVSATPAAQPQYSNYSYLAVADLEGFVDIYELPSSQSATMCRSLVGRFNQSVLALCTTHNEYQLLEISLSPFNFQTLAVCQYSDQTQICTDGQGEIYLEIE